MKTQSVTIDERFGAEFEGAYEFRQVTQGEYERVLVGYMDALGKVAKQDILKVNREMLWLSLARQPDTKPVTKDRLVQGQLPYGLSIRFQETYDKVNGLSAEEQRFLSEPSSTSELTQNSQNSSYASDSAGPNNNTTAQAGEP